MTRDERRKQNRKPKQWRDIILARIPQQHQVKIACSVWWVYADQIKEDEWFYCTRHQYTPDMEMDREELAKWLGIIGMPIKKIHAMTKTKYWDCPEHQRRHNLKVEEGK